MAKDLERIVAHLRGEDVKLTTHLEYKMNRLKRLCSMVLEHTDDVKCLNIYMELTGVEQAQAHRDLKDAQFIQGNVMGIDRKFERIRLYNKQKSLGAQSEQAGDLKNAISAYNSAAKIMGFDRVEMDSIDLTNYEGNTVIVEFNPELLGLDVNGQRPDESEIQKALAIAKNPRIDLDVDDYSEYEEIQEELNRTAKNTP